MFAAILLGTTLITYQNFDVSKQSSDDVLTAKALKIYRRITGTQISPQAEIINKMSALIGSNRVGEAVDLAMDENEFYDITLLEFASKMSTRELSVLTPLNDYSATFVGAVRDDLDARELLRGNFYYRGDAQVLPALSAANNDVTDLLTSNKHYDVLQAEVSAGRATLKTSLVKADQQITINGQGASVTMPDAAGLITSRSYLSSHVIAGTNRRAVEYLFKTFTCQNLSDLADSSSPDDFVGPDIERFPQGSNATFQTSCKGCHGAMDALRPAFSMFTFENNRVKHVSLFAASNNDTNNSTTNVQVDSKYRKVTGKYTRGSNVFPGGYFVQDTNWVNYFSRSKGQGILGFKTTGGGNTINQLGSMIAESSGFSGCMVKRTFESLCKRPIHSTEQKLLQDLRKGFESHYNIKKLYKSIAMTNECLGGE